ncbi:MAG: VanW family protein [Dethiobacter sp.]|nr:VanW family protein [Dethiobacter sp.]MBS3897486.1 VanW family protein [Dethiobacter sp.]MBS3983602.1 VanW family protein [Dethiobacter sp.]MCL4462845.1 VanW family protein [Bacillota bacterium]MCL5993602.1 VanW family protein [Bacillota bacterium]
MKKSNASASFRFLKLSTIFLTLLMLLIVFFSLNLGIRVTRQLYGVKPGVTLQGVAMERMLKNEVRQMVERMAVSLDREPRNARYDRTNKVIVPELSGRKVDVLTTIDAVMTAAEGEKVELAIITLDPEITTGLFQSINSKISAYSTSGGGSAGRTDNLYLAAKYMNGVILAPGDVFSFNKETGPRTFERGYSMAPVVGGMGIGGGVCQVATTIYNASLAAGLEIVERHQHSIRVGYVPPGRDATVTDYIDFKFRNSTDKYIQIRSGAGGGHVWVQLWSQ